MVMMTSEDLVNILKVSLTVTLLTVTLLSPTKTKEAEEMHCLKSIQHGKCDKKVFHQENCRPYSYGNRDLNDCFRNRRMKYQKQYNTSKPTWIVLIGDSKTLRLTNMIVDTIGGMQSVGRAGRKGTGIVVANQTYRYFPNTERFTHGSHTDLMHIRRTGEPIIINFYWQYTMRDERFFKVFNDIKTGHSPDLIVMGINLHYMTKYNSTGGDYESERWDIYRQDITKFIQIVESMGDKVPVLWKIGEPVHSAAVGAHKRHLYTNERIDILNSITVQMLREKHSRILEWVVPREAVLCYKDLTDGVHYSERSMGLVFQSLFNYFCNPFMGLKEDYCCNMNEKAPTASPADEVAKMGFIISGSVVIAVSFTTLFCRCLKNKLKTEELLTATVASETEKPPSQKGVIILTKIKFLIWTSVKLIFILNYFVICDRYLLFEHTTKNSSPKHFWIILACLPVVGCIRNNIGSNTNILNRNITEEMKGWMQVIILVYHYTNVSSNLPIYLHIRILVSAYLFLTGFSHFSYAWNGGVMGIKRYIKIMFRLNFLTLLLCLAMGKVYQNYYFVPLISFWFTFLFVGLSIAVYVNNTKLRNLCVKHVIFLITIAVMIAVIILLNYFEDMFKIVFGMGLWKWLFEIPKTDNPLHEWNFRWSLDRFSVLYGAVAGLILESTRQIKSEKDSSCSSRSLALLLFSCIGVFSYTLFAGVCGTKLQCNALHPYIVWIPITSYVYLRNVNTDVCQRFSPVFVFFGQISLELFVCQYHIWLADNSRKLLVILPSWPIINGLFTSVVLVAVAHELRNITNDVIKVF